MQFVFVSKIVGGILPVIDIDEQKPGMHSQSVISLICIEWVVINFFAFDNIIEQIFD